MYQIGDVVKIYNRLFTVISVLSNGRAVLVDDEGNRMTR